MSESIVMDLFRDALDIILVTSAPMLVTALIVGLIIAVFQATTQIQEQTLAFVPKIIAVFLVMLIMGPWLASTFIDYGISIFESLVLYVK